MTLMYDDDGLDSEMIGWLEKLIVAEQLMMIVHRLNQADIFHFYEQLAHCNEFLFHLED